MADGDYERGRGREIGAIAAELKRLAAARGKRTAERMSAAGPDGSRHGEVGEPSAGTAALDAHKPNGKGANG